MRSIGYFVIASGLIVVLVWQFRSRPQADQDEDALPVEKVRLIALENGRDVEPARSPNADQAAEGFRFPDDPAGEMLSKILTPSEKKPQLYPSSQPRLLSASPAVEHPVLPLPPAHVEATRLPQTKRPLIRPRPLAEERPILGNQLVPELPQAKVLAASDRVRLASVDPRQPTPLPISAQPVNDRFPIEDVTAEASLAGVLSSPPPARTAPAPFIKTRSPDPFENRLKTP
jgi:hypothetical protein